MECASSSRAWSEPSTGQVSISGLSTFRGLGLDDLFFLPLPVTGTGTGVRPGRCFATESSRRNMTIAFSGSERLPAVPVLGSIMTMVTALGLG